MTIYVAAWYVKSESGDDYLDQVVLAEKNMDNVYKHIIENCPEAKSMIDQEELDASIMSNKEILGECMLFPDVVWTEIKGEY